MLPGTAKAVVGRIPHEEETKIRWFRMPAEFIQEAALLGPHATAVFVVLAAAADNCNGSSFPAVATIAARAGMSERMVRYCLRKLEDRKWVTSIPHKGRSTTYTVYGAYGAAPPKVGAYHAGAPAQCAPYLTPVSKEQAT